MNSSDDELGAIRWNVDEFFQGQRETDGAFFDKRSVNSRVVIFDETRGDEFLGFCRVAGRALVSGF